MHPGPVIVDEVAALDDRLPTVADTLHHAGAAFALVFGSVARNQARLGSDLDLAAWWHLDSPHPWEIALPTDVDLVVLGAGTRIALELAGRIALEGQVLLDNDAAARVRWLGDTRKIWLDERYRFERSSREFLEALADGR